MKKRLTIFFLFVSILSLAQTQNTWKKNALVLTPEILLGITTESNDGFPETKLQKQAIFAIGRSQKNNRQQWAQRLKGPKTGLAFSYRDFGNLDSLGVAFTVLPFIEFKAFGSNRFKVLAGTGVSYFTKKFHAKTNPQNKAVTTDLTWAFRLYLYYQFLSTENIDWRLGLGYSHHSNGHTKLLNQGYNSFLLSLSADIKNPLNQSGKIASKELPT